MNKPWPLSLDAPPQRFSPDEIPRSVQLADENVKIARTGQVESTWSSIEIGGINEPSDRNNISRRIHEDIFTNIPTSPPQRFGPTKSPTSSSLLTKMS